MGPSLFLGKPALVIASALPRRVPHGAITDKTKQSCRCWSTRPAISAIFQKAHGRMARWCLDRLASSWLHQDATSKFVLVVNSNEWCGALYDDDQKRVLMMQGTNPCSDAENVL